MFSVMVARAGDVAVRTDLFTGVVRLMDVVWVLRADVAVRGVVRAGAVAVRLMILLRVVRDAKSCFVLFVFAREIVSRLDVRDAELASRTAASAMLTLKKSAVIRYSAFFILGYMDLCYQKMLCLANKKCPKRGIF